MNVRARSDHEAGAEVARNQADDSKPALLIAAVVLALGGCTSLEPEVTDRFEVALTVPVPDLGGATIEEEVYARAGQVCPGIHPPFIVFNTGAKEPGFTIDVDVALKASPRPTAFSSHRPWPSCRRTPHRNRRSTSRHWSPRTTPAGAADVTARQRARCVIPATPAAAPHVVVPAGFRMGWSRWGWTDLAS